ncbi:MAG: hypothetical protein AAGA90_22240 [Actinomycetota bacterium]
MSGLTERVERDLAEMAGLVSPSTTDAWAAIQRRIDDPDVLDETEIIMLNPDSMPPADRRSTWLRVAAAATAALFVIGGVILLTGGDDEVDVAGQAAQTEASPLPFAGSDLLAGRYSTTVLGPEITVDIPLDGRLWTARPNHLVVDTSVGDQPEVDVRGLSMTRIAGWNTEEERTDPLFQGPGSIDALDLDAWLEDPGLEHGEVTDVEVGGLSARMVDVTVIDTEPSTDFRCPEGETCSWPASRSGRVSGGRYELDPTLWTGQISRIWLVTMDDFDPLMIRVYAGQGDEAWIDDVTATTIAAMTIDGAAPPPGN